MIIIIITWKIETGQVLLEYKVNEQLRRCRVLIEDFKNKILLDNVSSGLNVSNWEDAINNIDPKHTIKEEMVVGFVKWYHNI